MRRDEDVDEVELQEPEPPDHLLELARPDRPARPGAVEALRRQRQAARLGERQLGARRRHAPSLARRLR